MGRYHIEVEAFSSASPEEIWALLADVRTWSAWGPWDESDLLREGTPPPEGSGALRMLRRGRTVSIEQVVDAVPAERLSYRLLDGLPVHGYLAEVSLEQRSSGTIIRWCATFDGARPMVGAVLRPALRSFIRRVAWGLARAAEQRTPALQR